MCDVNRQPEEISFPHFFPLYRIMVAVSLLTHTGVLRRVLFHGYRRKITAAWPGGSRRWCGGGRGRARVGALDRPERRAAAKQEKTGTPLSLDFPLVAKSRSINRIWVIST